MMTISENVSLLPYNTFGIDVNAAQFAAAANVADLASLRTAGLRPALVLGGGSNILLTGDVGGLALKNAFEGMAVLRPFKNKVWVRAGSGENWHRFVQWCVNQGFGGIENLSLIPGTVGAAPIQNIGAYGVELKDVFVYLEAYDWESGQIRRFNKTECRFGYRDSVFKHEAKGRYFITAVVLSLDKAPHHLNTSYGDIQKTLASMHLQAPDIAAVSEAVIQIRSSKLPDPAKIGNCGSFFKNPETDRAVLERIRETHPHVIAYELPGNRVKIPAGWLIEQCGWKGKRVGNTGCYEKQALVLVNYGGATGAEVKKLAHDIIDSVKTTFGIALEPEVNIIG